MNKSEIRKSIFHASGCDADDWLEGAKRSGYAFEGAKKALKKAAQEVLSVAVVVKQDLEAGKLEGLDASEIADYAILQVTRAKDSLENSSQHYENRQLATQGEIAAYDRVVKHFKSLHDREEAKIQSIREAEEVEFEDDDPTSKSGSRTTGVRPSAGLAAKRRAEDAKEDKLTTSEVSAPPKAPNKRQIKKDGK